MRKILLVDDEADFCYFLKQNLEAAGDFQVSICSDAHAAFPLARALKPNLVLLDVYMPGLSGPEIAQQLQATQETHDVPVVFLTALATEEEVAKASHWIGGRCVVAKPIKVEDLVRVIETVAA